MSNDPNFMQNQTPKNQRRFRQLSPGLQQMISQQPLHCACPNVMQCQQVLPNASQFRSETMAVECKDLGCLHVPMHGGERFIPSVFPGPAPLYILRQCLSLELELTSCWTSYSKPWGSSCLSVCNAGAHVCTATPSFVQGWTVTQAASHTDITSVWPTAQSPWWSLYHQFSAPKHQVAVSLYCVVLECLVKIFNDLWLGIGTAVPAEMALSLLVPFCTTYLPEEAFSVLTSVKSTHRSNAEKHQSWPASCRIKYSAWFSFLWKLKTSISLVCKFTYVLINGKTVCI